MPKIKISCVGDSITFGAGIKDRRNKAYPAQLNKLLGDKYEVKNFGVNGATLLKKGDKPYWELEAYKNALASKADIYIIKLGTNDTKTKNWKFKENYKKNYLELISSFRQTNKNAKIFICIPVPAFPERWSITDKKIRTEVKPLVIEVAQEAKCELIDLYTPLIGRADLVPDKIHPNAAGAAIIAATVFKAIKK